MLNCVILDRGEIKYEDDNEAANQDLDDIDVNLEDILYKFSSFLLVNKKQIIIIDEI